MALVPDSDYLNNRTEIQTEKYHLISMLVKNQAEAIEAAKNLVFKESVNAFILCPGFSHKAIADIVDAVEEGVSVNPPRGDKASAKAAFDRMTQIGWFS